MSGHPEFFHIEIGTDFFSSCSLGEAKAVFVLTNLVGVINHLGPDALPDFNQLTPSGF